MADFTVRSDHIDVEQIMRQIRARIRDKRGADYTEAEIRELANVKLDKFLDPRAVRSDLLLHYRQQRRPANEAPMPLYAFDPSVVYVSDRGTPGRILTFIRKLLNPILKLFFNPSPMLHVMHLQTQINDRVNKALVTREEFDALNFEMFNNLVVELTRLGIEVRNLRMQVESFGTRLDFDERRARALEGAVQYKPGAPVARPPQPSQAASQQAAATSAAASAATAAGQTPGSGGDEGDEEDGVDGETGRARRRRRRRGRRRGQGGQGEGAGEGTGEGPVETTGAGSPRAEGQSGQPYARERERDAREPREPRGVTGAPFAPESSRAATEAVTTESGARRGEDTTPLSDAPEAWGRGSASYEETTAYETVASIGETGATEVTAQAEAEPQESEHDAFWKRIAERSTNAATETSDASAVEAIESAAAVEPGQSVEGSSSQPVESTLPVEAPAAPAVESVEAESGRKFTRVFDDEAPAPQGAGDAFTTGGADAPADEAATGGTESAGGETTPDDSESSRS